MKRWMFFITIGLLGLTACTSFHGVTAISPKTGHPYHPTKVDNLHPTLEWKSSSQGDETYDVIIYEVLVKGVRKDSMWNWPYGGEPMLVYGATGKMVYYRERIKETYHKVEDPLEPDTHYYWSVRVRQGDKVSEWSRYDYLLYAGIGYLDAKNCWFYFKTPKSK